MSPTQIPSQTHGLHADGLGDFLKASHLPERLQTERSKLQQRLKHSCHPKSPWGWIRIAWIRRKWLKRIHQKISPDHSLFLFQNLANSSKATSPALSAHHFLPSTSNRKPLGIRKLIAIIALSVSTAIPALYLRLRKPENWDKIGIETTREEVAKLLPNAVQGLSSEDITVAEYNRWGLRWRMQLTWDEGKISDLLKQLILESPEPIYWTLVHEVNIKEVNFSFTTDWGHVSGCPAAPDFSNTGEGPGCGPPFEIP